MNPFRTVKVGYVMHTPLGSYCTACQSILSDEEADWDECDTCGGDGSEVQDEDTGWMDDYGPVPSTKGLAAASIPTIADPVTEGGQ